MGSSKDSGRKLWVRWVVQVHRRTAVAPYLVLGAVAATEGSCVPRCAGDGALCVRGDHHLVGRHRVHRLPGHWRQPLQEAGAGGLAAYCVHAAAAPAGHQRQQELHRRAAATGPPRLACWDCKYLVQPTLPAGSNGSSSTVASLSMLGCLTRYLAAFQCRCCSAAAVGCPIRLYHPAVAQHCPVVPPLKPSPHTPCPPIPPAPR